jgi:hypothetical protein
MRVFNKRQVAGKLGVNERTVDRLIAGDYGLPTVQISPGRVGILESDLFAWLVKQRRLPRGWVDEPISTGDVEDEAPRDSAPAQPVAHRRTSRRGRPPKTQPPSFAESAQISRKNPAD